MAGLDHASGPRPAAEVPLSARQTFYGRVLFFVYLVLYGGFVLLNAFAPEVMEETPFAGVNLAVLYGLMLIVAAFLFALLYDRLCRMPTDKEAGR